MINLIHDKKSLNVQELHVLFNIEQIYLFYNKYIEVNIVRWGVLNWKSCFM